MNRESHAGNDLLERLAELKAANIPVYGLKRGQTNAQWIIEFGEAEAKPDNEMKQPELI